MMLASETGDREVYNEAKFGCAVVNAEKQMENFLSGYGSKIGRKLY